MSESHAHGPVVPRTRPLWVLLVLMAFGALGVGVYCFSQQAQHGLILTGLRNPGYGFGAWGLYIAFDVFFVGVSFAGITVAAICRLGNIAILKPITRIAELLTICALLAGGAVVLADLGRPLHGLLKLPRYANPSSPFYGTFTLVLAGYMFSSLVYFFLAGRADAAALARNPNIPLRWFYKGWASGYRDRPEQRVRHHRISFILAISILPLLVAAHSTLGFIFGIQGGRPGWFSALQAPGFVVMAGVSGTGMLIAVAAGFRRLFRLKTLPDASFRWLGNFMWILAAVYLYFMMVEELTATYAAPEADRHVAHEIVAGRFAPIFWLTVGCLFLTFLIPFILFLVKKASVPWLCAAGLLANVAAVCKRFLIVVPSQTDGSLIVMEGAKTYTPSWVEFGVITGLFGLVALAMLLFGRIFPLVPSPHAVPETGTPKQNTRIIAAVFVIIVSVGLIFLGLTDSFRLWSGEEYDPRIPYAPVIFASGLMLLFISAIVFEVFPDRVGQIRRHLLRRPKGSGQTRGQDTRTRVLPLPDRSAIHNLANLAAEADAHAQQGDARRAVEALRALQEQSEAFLAKRDGRKH